MKNVIKKIIPFASSLAVGLSTTCIVSSCGVLNPKIESITLSARREYIYPGEKLKIKAKLFPILSSKEDLIWSIDSPVEGFTISDEGWLKAPETFAADDSFSVQIKATSKKDPNIFDTFSLLAIANTEKRLLGLSGELEYLGRDGKPASRKILKTKSPTGGDLYYLEGANPNDPIEKQDGINLYTGRIDEFIKFTPIFRPDVSKYMKFHLYNNYAYDNPDYNCVSWVGYKNDESTLDIPKIMAVSPWYHKQYIQVTFDCEKDVSVGQSYMEIICDVYQNPRDNSLPVFDYNPNPKEDKPRSEDQHSVTYLQDGMYTSQIICSKNLKENTEKRVGDIYLYRKPYEEMEQSLKGVWKPNIDAPNIFTEEGKPKVSDLKFGTYLPGSWNYPIATFDLTYTVDQDLIKDLDYDSFLIGTYHVYDISDVECKSHIATLEFWVQWIEE
ncbi:MAG: hypothetical protein ACOQNY_01030 [Mycoplasmoidaceae bacterium]